MAPPFGPPATHPYAAPYAAPHPLLPFPATPASITPISDISLGTVLAAVYVNIPLCLLLLLSFELLRRLLPRIFLGHHYHKEEGGPPEAHWAQTPGPLSGLRLWHSTFCTSWSSVLRTAGLDYYMFLRYIRLCYKLCLVSSLYCVGILAPTYATAGGREQGWYRISLKNVPAEAQAGSAAQSAAEEGITPSMRVWVAVAVM
jgi:hypothetical protein